MSLVSRTIQSTIFENLLQTFTGNLYFWEQEKQIIKLNLP